MNGKDIIIIANFVDDFSYKGTSRFVYIADMLAENNNVELITSDFCHIKKSGKELPENNRFKITLLHECGYPKNVCLKRFKSHKIFGINVRDYLNTRKKPDIIYCAVPSLDCAYYASEYAVNYGIRFIVDIQDLWPEAFQMVFNVPVLSKLIFAPMKKKVNEIYKAADIIVGVSDTYCKRAADVNEKKASCLTVYLGTDLVAFDKHVADNNVKKDIDKFILAYCGTLGHSYDLKCVFDALVLLKKRYIENVELRVFGDGPLKEEFEEYVKDKDTDVVFYGRLPYPEMCGELSACDVAVNPIRRGAAQSIINKHADYAAAGIPVINTQESEEYRSLIDKFEFGINCECGNSEDVAKAIETLYGNKAVRDKMGNNARRFAENYFDRQTSYMKIINAICDEVNHD